MTAENLRDVANVLLVLGLILAACGTFGVNYFRGRVEAERIEAARARERDAEANAGTLRSQVTELVAGKDELLHQNQELSGLVKSLKGTVGEREATIERLQAEVDAVRRFNYIATLTMNGSPYMKGDVTVTTAISRLVEGTWREVSDNSFRPICEPAAVQKNRAAIQQFPEFPFTYYALAYCLQKQADPQWRVFATQAVAIFEKTTAINGHTEYHDQCLAYLRQLLAGS
jgi:hypothetical protein